MNTPHTDSWEERFDEDYNKGVFGWKTHSDKSREPVIIKIVELKNFIKTVEKASYKRGAQDLAIPAREEWVKKEKEIRLSERQRIREVIESKKKLEVGVSPEALMWKQRWNRDMDILLSHLEDKEITI